jgi:hypothetical protein
MLTRTSDGLFTNSKFKKREKRLKLRTLRPSPMNLPQRLVRTSKH